MLLTNFDKLKSWKGLLLHEKKFIIDRCVKSYFISDFDMESEMNNFSGISSSNLHLGNGRKSQNRSNKERTQHPAVGNHYSYSEKYKRRYRNLRKIIKAMMFENAALCDEVAQMQDRILRAKEERRFLLKKLFQYQAVNDVSGDASPKTTPSLMMNTVNPGHHSTMVEGTEVKQKRKITMKKKSAKDLLESLKAKTKRKKSATVTKRLVQSIPLDSTGRPIFPIVLGGLTIHSLGEVVSDRPGFHTEDYIFPVGFCSTRTYASRKNPEQKCLYTCKITDNGAGPKFEIVADDDHEHPVVASSSTECHRILLQAINKATNVQVVDPTGCGPEFFGFSHPTIQNLIQSCPRARKCSSYKWVKFEVCKADQINDAACMSDNDASLNFDALQRNINFITANVNSTLQDIEVQQSPTDDETSSLRSLLTSNNIGIIGT